jgi:hypothetical protein
MTACQEAIEACLESMEPASEEIESESEHQGVPKGEEAVETVKALKKWYGDWHLAVQCRLQLQKSTQGYGKSQKTLVTAHRMMLCHNIPARRQGPGRDNLARGTLKGQTFRKRH